MTERPLVILSHLPSGLLARVTEEHPSARIVEVPSEGPLDEGIEGEVLLTQAWGSPNLADVLRRGVGWVHAYGTGVDAFSFAALGDRPVTCSRGASAIPISEWVLGVMLAFEKQLPGSWLSAPPERWNIAFLGGLHGRTLGLLGIGGIGQAVATRALAFGMEVLALRRSDRSSPVPGVRVVGDLDEVLARADHLVVAAPATSQTRGLLGRDALRRVKLGVHLVNVARGDLVDQEALREALDDGRVARASLDVCTPEPLPAGHWLYEHPRVRLSPHISWSSPEALTWLIEPFVENLHRYLRGAPLAHQVDPTLGY